jgi:dihydropteroate synthase
MQEVELVGVLNLTPDSFSGDGIPNSAKRAIAQAEEMFGHGASIIDVGAEATNPWATPITPDEEWRRLEPVITKLISENPGRIAVDSYHPETVQRVVKTCGTNFIVNDVTGMNNPKMREIVAKYGLRCIVSHLPIKFGTDIKEAHAKADVDDAKQVLERLLERRQQLMDLGLYEGKIILDPGIGFGKTMRLNWDLLQFADLVKKAGIDNEVMVGYSHKRFLGEHRFEIEPNLEAARIAIDAGTKYLRVHDVAAHYDYLHS